MASQKSLIERTETWRWQNFLPTRLLSIVAVAIVVVVGVLADWQGEQLFLQHQRHDVQHDLQLLTKAFERGIFADAQLVQGLVATIATEPEMSQERFSELAERLYWSNTSLRSVAGAPDLKISLIHPLAGNEAAIGLDYNKNDAQRNAAFRARQEGKFVLAGPVDLVQGGKAFIGRIPVFISEGNREIFWGLVSAVFDQEKLYNSTGLAAKFPHLEIAIRGKDASGPVGEQFYGETITFMNDPELLEMHLPVGSWQFAAVPQTGWGTSVWQRQGRRLLIVAAALLVILPIFGASLLAEHRHKSAEQIRKREAQLDRLSKRLELALDISKVGVWEYHPHTDQLFWDDRMNELYGLPVDGGARNYHHWRDAIIPEDLARATADFNTAIETGQRYESEFRVSPKPGTVRTIRTYGAVYGDDRGQLKILGVNWDVSADRAMQSRLMQTNALMEARNRELEIAKERIEHIAHHDALTGLPNRWFLDQKLESWAENSEPTDFALLIIDLDRFKQINDTLGHAAGDMVLKHVASVLQEAVGPSDFVARVGGDEFVIVCRNNIDEPQLVDLANWLIEKMQAPVDIEGCECRFGVSIGIAVNNQDATAPRQVLVNADIALYRAKSDGRNRFAIFTRRLQADAVYAKQLADEILNGIEENEFIPFYQAKFDAKSRQIVGVEALVRWNHPRRGLLTPEVFLDVATDLNVLHDIDEAILKQAVTDIAAWEEQGWYVPNVSVNVSAKRLQDGDLINTLKQLSPPPGRISFELVESIYFDDASDQIVWTIDQLKELGIDIEIDDFGTGHASVVGLLKLRPKKLKIDRHLIMPVVRSQAQRRLVQSMIDIGKSLGIEVVAEGVETLDHAAVLQEMGCDELQGFAFARPVPAFEIVNMTYFAHFAPVEDSPAGGRQTA